MALTNIILTIDDYCNASFITLRDTKAVRNNLKEMYGRVHEARIVAHVVQYQQLRMQPTAKVME